MVICLLQIISFSSLEAFNFLRYEYSAISQGELWRLLTGQLIHINFKHFLLNITAWLLLIIIAYRLNIIKMFWEVMLWCWLFTGIGLFFIFPEIIWYVGMSGFLHGVALFLILYFTKNINRIFGLIFLIGFVLKLIIEINSTIHNMDFVVINQAHFIGSLVGLIYIVFAITDSQQRPLLLLCR